MGAPATDSQIIGNNNRIDRNVKHDTTPNPKWLSVTHANVSQSKHKSIYGSYKQLGYMGKQILGRGSSVKGPLPTDRFVTLLTNKEFMKVRYKVQLE